MGRLIGTLLALSILSPFTSQATNKFLYGLNAEESLAIANTNYGIGRGGVYGMLYLPGTLAGNAVFYRCNGLEILDADKTKKDEVTSEAFRKIGKSLGIDL